MLNWELENKTFQLKYNWKLSRNETFQKTNFFIKVSDGLTTGMGEGAPNIRYQETPESVFDEFQILLSDGLNNISNISEYQEYIKQKTLSNCLKHALESAIVSFSLKKINVSFYEYYKIKQPHLIETSYTIPIIDPKNVKTFYADYKLNEYNILKLKINQELAFDLIKELAHIAPSQAIILDANEAWNDVDDLIRFSEKLYKFNIKILEQPFPDLLKDEYKYFKKYAPYPVFADESIKNQEDLEEIALQFHGINIKLMKTGGYQVAFKLLEEAKKFKLQTMLGCMVESSLGIYNAAQMSTLFDFIDLDSHLLIENEPFNKIHTQYGKLKMLV
jgi:L-alanine-DL-glutamate epimerase-like enolase superfamily enzyme